jgi:hypothetical protein
MIVIRWFFWLVIFKLHLIIANNDSGYNWYFLCLHINCPIEATGYKCCTSENYGNKTRVVCNGEPIYFDNAWWVVPFIIGLLMFSYSPFLLVKVFHHSAYSSFVPVILRCATFISSGLDRTINMQTKKIPVVITNI